METYWQSNDESPEAFWAHEWSTHGTCVSTLEPSCFSGYTSGAEVRTIPLLRLSLNLCLWFPVLLGDALLPDHRQPIPRAERLPGTFRRRRASLYLSFTQHSHALTLSRRG